MILEPVAGKENITENFVESVGNVALEMVSISGGEFMMGSPEDETGFRKNEGPRHRVVVPGFYLGKHQVTQNLWSDVMGTLPEMGPDFYGGELPVVNVWLESAIEFCRRLSSITGRTYRLPTEAEWEYACRAGTTTPFSFGHTLETTLANFDGRQPYGTSSIGEFRGCTSPAGFFQVPNAFGVCDMHGNVWEWCADTWHEDYVGAPTDGTAWTAGGDQGYCVQRGGSWTDRAANCRSAFRVGDVAHNSNNIVGLRVALSGYA